MSEIRGHRESLRGIKEGLTARLGEGQWSDGGDDGEEAGGEAHGDEKARRLDE